MCVVRQGRVSRLMYKDTMGAGDKAQAALLMMKSIKHQQQKRAGLGC